jgi:hypothetical protein
VYTPKGGTFSSRLSGDMGQLKKSNKELLEMALGSAARSGDSLGHAA